MQVVMMESEAYQNLIDRLERIEKYVIRATERHATLPSVGMPSVCLSLGCLFAFG